MDQGKVKAVQNWPLPFTIKELQPFQGFANFYRRFISNFSKISSQLTSLLCNWPKSLSWTPAATRAFHQLQEDFTIDPTLVHPNPDPSTLHPCAFFSKKLSSVGQNYDIRNRELLTIKLALEESCHWMEGANHPFEVIMDH